MKWTNEQEKAIKTKNCNLLVSAGAGSGKTAVLVERIISKVIIEKVDITNILVVTFTNAAATEMKERILTKLYEKLEQCPEDMWIQQQILNINSANITTIHAFCLGIIKQYYYEIGIEPNLKITNEIDDQLMQYEVLQEMFDVQYEKELADTEFLNLLEIFNEKNETDNLKEVILKLYKFIANQPFKDVVLDKLYNSINSANLSNFETTLWGKEYISQCVNMISEIIFEHNEIIQIVLGDEKQVDFYNNSKIRAEELLNINGLKWDEVINKFNSYKLDRRVALKGYDEETKELVEAHWKSIKKLVEALSFNIYEQDIVKQNEINKTELTYLINMVRDFDDRFKAKKQKKKVIDFNDFEHYALNILLSRNEKGEIIPSSVAKEYRKKFVEILIDEYQDSNYIQEYILNTISTSDEGNPNIFMVGDVKQSIYKFRGAKPEMFLEKYNSYDTEESKYMKINLYKNFRSREKILQYINYIFSNIMSKELGKIDYTEEEFLNYGADYETIHGNNDKIEIDIIEIQKEDNEESEEVTDNVEEIKGENIEYEAQYIANKIKELVKQQYKVQDKKTKEYRQVRYSDIVILLRSTKSIAPIFNQVFKDNHIPIYVDNRVGYLDELEVSEVLSFLEIIDNPYQDIPLISVLKSLFGNFNDNELADIRQYDKIGYFYTAMQKASVTNKRVNDFLIKLNQYTEMSKTLSVSKLIWNIYEDYKYIQYMKRYKDYESKKANLMLLFERAKEFEQSSYRGLFNFINFITRIRDNNQDMGNATILGENDNVVRLMSIHKSKGLEFSVVFLANTDRKFNYRDLSSKLLIHQELLLGNEIVDIDKRIAYPSIFKKVIAKNMKEEIVAEEMRMLYVALTRAKEKLFITGITSNYEKTMVKAKTNTKSQLVSYLSMITYVIFSKGYDKDIIEVNHIKQSDINKEVSSENDADGVDLKLMLEDMTKSIDNGIGNEDVYNQIDKSMKYEYDKKYLSKIPHKISVSEIKRKHQESEEEIVNIYSSLPKWLDKNTNDISALEKGNIYHYILEQLDFRKNYTMDELEKAIKGMNRISEKEYSAIDIEKIYNFTQSNIYKQAMQSDVIYKEQPFMLEQNIKEVAGIFDIDNIQKDNDTVLIQGTIDMFYIIDNEIIIVDYKTDRVSDEKEIIKRYRVQIEYYKIALEKLLNKKVKSAYIFLIDNGKVIEVE